jgi:hypothetical protein
MADGSTSGAVSTDVLKKLAAVSDDKLLEVIRYLSAVPATSDTLKLMDQLRPKLRTLRPPRPPALKRLWCRAFEDLLRTGPAEAAGGRISRSAIEPCWRLLLERGAAWLPGLDAELRGLSAREPKRILAVGERLWSQSAAVIDQALADGVDIPHLALLRDVLAAAVAIEAFKQAIPAKPIVQFGDTEIAAARAGLADLARRGLPTYGFLMAIAVRLDNPSDLLFLQERVDAGFSPALMHQVSALTVARLDGQADDLERLAADASANEVAQQAEALMQGLAAARDGQDEATRKLADARAASLADRVRKVLKEKIIEPATELIERAMPGLETEASRDELLQAEEHARSLGRARPVARMVGMDQQAGETADAICRRFEGKLGELLDQIDKGAKHDASVDNDIYRSIRIVELVDGPLRARKWMLAARQRLKGR